MYSYIEKTQQLQLAYKQEPSLKPTARTMEQAFPNESKPRLTTNKDSFWYKFFNEIAIKMNFK